MIELLIGLMTAGGSAGFGSILKIIGAWRDSVNKQKELDAQIEMQRRAKEQGYEIDFQGMFSDSYSKTTRRLLALIGMVTLSIISIWCCVFPELVLTTFSRESGSINLLFGAFSYPVTAKTTQVTLGHIALVTSTVVYPMIVGFYFTPGGRR
jgi:hypothetical protein